MTKVKILYSKFDKKAIPDLPKVEFGGRIIVIQTAGEADRAVNYLMQFPQLGIDTETRPNFKPGGMNPVALLQVSTPEACFLFRLNRFGLTDSLVQLFTSEAVEKIGLSLHDDWAQLRKRVEFQPVNYVELQDYVKPFGIQDMSLQKLYANFFGQKISKNQRLTNWEADVLTEPQKRYAATDAWSCLQLYQKMTELLTTRAYKLIEVPEPENSVS
jgi:ribonuclease D